MNAQTRREIRSGLIALALAGLLFALAVALRGPVDTDPDSVVQAALSSHFVPDLTIGVVTAQAEPELRGRAPFRRV
jgi:hypothetical protein